jgi:hypothetical protein
MNSQTLALTPTEQSIVDLNLPLPDFNAVAEPTPADPMPEAVRPKLTFTFKQIATPMICRNIPVIPLRPGTKIAFLTNWVELASTDPNQVDAWDKEYHESNGACVAQAKLGGTWFFEVDNPEVRERIERETGMKLPETFQVTSSPGKGHFYFNQTDASIAMGNLQGKDAAGKEAWSARVDNRYVVAPRSIHPSTGKLYEVSSNVAVVSAPLWLIQWIKDHAVTEGAAGRVNASPDGPPIPRGSHDNELFRSACALRNAGMDYDQIRDNLIQICEKRCTDHGADYVDMCEKKAGQAVKYPVGTANPKVTLGKSIATVEETADVSNWRSLFSNVSEMQQGEVEMVVAGVLQEDGTCFFGASAGHGKTLLALSLTKAITLGQPLFGMPEFAVKTPRHVIYLMAESSDRAFRKRCEFFGLPKDDRFIARTLTKGLPLALSDPGLLEAVRQLRPVVFIDTTSRFNQGGDENSAAANQLLANDVTALRGAGAMAVVLLHHAKKAATREAMTQENMLRGTSDFAAMGDHTYGLRLDERLYNHGAGPMEIDVVNLKDREQLGSLTTLRLAATYMKPGTLRPTSYINEMGDFRPVDWTETKDRVRETLNQMVEANLMVSVKELCGATSLNPRKVREILGNLGWHSVAGGPDKRSPWHKDEGKPCPYEEAKKKGRKGVVDFGESEPVFKPPVRVN